jgi:hypothetical protein
MTQTMQMRRLGLFWLSPLTPTLSNPSRALKIRKAPNIIQMII